MDNLVTFRVGESLYALPADLVAEVVEIGPIAHQVLADEGGGPGLTRVRGRWVPVVELAGMLPGVGAVAADAESSVLLLLGRGRGGDVDRAGRRSWRGRRRRAFDPHQVGRHRPGRSQHEQPAVLPDRVRRADCLDGGLTYLCDYLVPGG